MHTVITANFKMQEAQGLPNLKEKFALADGGILHPVLA